MDSYEAPHFYHICYDKSSREDNAVFEWKTSDIGKNSPFLLREYFRRLMVIYLAEHVSGSNFTELTNYDPSVQWLWEKEKMAKITQSWNPLRQGQLQASHMRGSGWG